MSWLYNFCLGYKGSWFSSQDNKEKKIKRQAGFPSNLGEDVPGLQSKGLRTHTKSRFCASPDGGQTAVRAGPGTRTQKNPPPKYASLTALGEWLPFCH